MLRQWFLAWVRSNLRGSVSQFHGFGGLVHPARLCINTVYSYIYRFWIWRKKVQTMKGSMNACMKLVGFSTSNKVKNHCANVIQNIRWEYRFTSISIQPNNLTKDLFLEWSVLIFTLINLYNAADCFNKSRSLDLRASIFHLGIHFELLKL